MSSKLIIEDVGKKTKEDLKVLILNSAKKLFVEKGIEQTTIRNISDSIGCSIGTVYVYFKDKNAIFHALHTQGFIQLSSEFKVLSHVGNPLERLRAMGKVYINFALENRDMYDLMFNLKAPMEFLNDEKLQEWNEGKATFDILCSTVSECLTAGYFKGHELEPTAFMIWSMVHGMCSLEISNRSVGVNIQNPETIVIAAYEEFMKIMDKL